MKTLSIEINDEEHERLGCLADVLGLSVEAFLAREGIDFIVSGMEFSVAHNLAARIWDTPEEARLAAVKSDAIDETAYWWAILKRPEGDFLLEVGEDEIAKAQAAGNTLVDCGLSADWKEAA